MARIGLAKCCSARVFTSNDVRKSNKFLLRPRSCYVCLSTSPIQDEPVRVPAPAMRSASPCRDVITRNRVREPMCPAGRHAGNAANTMILCDLVADGTGDQPPRHGADGLSVAASTQIASRRFN